MRRLMPMQMGNIDPQVQSLFNEIFRASLENDTVDIAQAFSFTGTPTATRNLNVSAPTLANIVAVLATLLQDLQRGGTNKNT